MSVKDELAHVLADSLNKQFKDTKVAYFLDGSDTTPTDIKEFVSTGSSVLDLAISNRPNGGVAVGRITEINGLVTFLKKCSVFKGFLQRMFKLRLPRDYWELDFSMKT